MSDKSRKAHHLSKLRRNATILVAATSAAGIGLSACGGAGTSAASGKQNTTKASTSSSAPAKKATTVSLIVSSVNVYYAPAEIAEAVPSLYTKYGINLHVTYASNASVPQDAIETGAADIVAAGPNLLGIGYKAPKFTCFATSGSTNTYLMAATNITSITQFKGKTLAAPIAGGEGDVILRQILAAHGLKAPTDYSITYVGNASGLLGAMKKGLTAGSLAQVPLNFKEIQTAHDHELLNVTKTKFGLADVAPFAATNTFIKAHPNVITNFIRAYNGAAKYIANNQSVAAVSLAQISGVTVTEAKKEVQVAVSNGLAMGPMSKKVVAAMVQLETGEYPGLTSQNAPATNKFYNSAAS